MPGDVTLWPTLTGGEVIDLLGRLRGGADRKRRDELLQRFELDPTRRCRTYSKGNRQKVALVAALASDVELLVLDEPTSGLDPLMEAEFGAAMAEERDRGRTVLLSSHILSEVETLCHRVSIVRAGRTVESATLPSCAAPAARSSPPSWPPRRPGSTRCPACTIWRSRDSVTSRAASTPGTSTRCSACSPRRACTASQPAAVAGGAVPRPLPRGCAGRGGET